MLHQLPAVKPWANPFASQNLPLLPVKWVWCHPVTLVWSAVQAVVGTEGAKESMIALQTQRQDPPSSMDALWNKLGNLETGQKAVTMFQDPNQGILI